MSERSEIRDEKKAEAQYQRDMKKEQAVQDATKEARKCSFSISISGTKDVATAQVAEQVKDSALGAALKALVAAAPGNSLSLAGSMDAADDSSKGRLTLTGIFKTIPEEVIKAQADSRAADDMARSAASAASSKKSKSA